jgi:hypothetical protein
MENKQQAADAELQNNWASENWQAQQNVNADDYKSLQSEFTKTRQAQIDLAVKLASTDKKSILELDKDLQDKVIKKIYWLDNLEELKVIHWDNFYKSKEIDEEDDEDELTRIKKELELIKYNQNKNNLEWAIEQFKKDNKDIFNNEEAEIKLRNEIKYISSDLQPNERINRAFRIAFGINPTDAAYLAMKETVTKWWNSNSQQSNWVNISSVEDEIKAIFRKK